MCFKYYESKDESTDSFNFGDVNLILLSKKDKYPGLTIRKIQATRKGQIIQTITHVQETMWEDNKAPDYNAPESNDQSFTRVNYMIQKMKKNRNNNPLGKVLVHCR